MVRASDSGARGRGFDPHSGRRVVSVAGDVTIGSWSQMTEPTPWTASDDLMMSYPFML